MKISSVCVTLLDCYKVFSEKRLHFICVCMCSLEECKECHDHKDNPVTAVVQPDTESPKRAEPMKERPVEEVAARLAQQDQEEQDIVACRLAIHTHKHTQTRNKAVTCQIIST